MRDPKARATVSVILMVLLDSHNHAVFCHCAVCSVQQGHRVGYALGDAVVTHISPSTLVPDRQSPNEIVQSLVILLTAMRNQDTEGIWTSVANLRAPIYIRLPSPER